MISVATLMAGKKQKLVISLSPTDTVQKAIDIMKANNISSVVVMSDGMLRGFVSERDICRKAQWRTPDNYILSEIMTGKENLVTVTPRTTCEEAMKLMVEHDIRHLIVLEESKVIGVVSSKDVLAELVRYNQQMVGHLERYITHG